jgi:hypothetical protein
MLDPRFAAAQGGVARQAYGLGSIVKKATKAVKKIVKSDIGKAAIGLASLYYGPKLFKADKGFSSWKDVNFLKSMQGKRFTLDSWSVCCCWFGFFTRRRRRFRSNFI